MLRKNVENNKKDLVTRSMLVFAFNFITVLIPVLVLGSELYTNVQILSYRTKLRNLRRDVLPYIAPDYLPVKVSPEKEEMLRNRRTKVSFFEKVLREADGYIKKLFFRFAIGKSDGKDGPSENNSVKKQKEECSYETLKSMVDKLRAEKKRLENLQNATKYGFEFDLELPKPEHIKTVFYRSEDVTNKRIEANASLQKPERMTVRPNSPLEVSPNEWNFKTVFLLVMEGYKEIKNWILYSPAEVEPRVLVENLSRDKVTELLIPIEPNLDIEREYLFEKF